MLKTLRLPQPDCSSLPTGRHGRWIASLLVLLLLGWGGGVDAEENPASQTDEILFRVNQLTIPRSQVELEFLAQVPVEQLVQPKLSADERKRILEATWSNAVKEVIDTAILQAQSRDELDYLDFVARIEPRALNAAVDQNLRLLEKRYGGAEMLQRQMKRYHINQTQLRQRMVVSFGINMFLRRKFSTLSKSTPDQQREWYRQHPLLFAASGKLRLQRLAVKFAPGPDQTAEQIEQGIAAIAQAWQRAENPDVLAAELQKGPAFLPAWTVLTAAADDGDWIEFDRLPDALRAAARLPIGTVLPPISVAELAHQQAFQAAGPAALRSAAEVEQDGTAVLLFRIAEQKVVLRPYDEVQGMIRDQLDDDIFRAAKHTFLEQIRKSTRVTAAAGVAPPISPWLLKIDFPAAVPPPPQPTAPSPGIAPPGEAPPPTMPVPEVAP